MFMKSSINMPASANSNDNFNKFETRELETRIRRQETRNKKQDERKERREKRNENVET
jgi:hypothetical protein